MKRTCRILVCLIAAIMIVSALPFTVFAQDDTQIECGYVTDGLVSWYDASNHGTSDAVWEDLVGNNDITVEKGYSYSSNSTLAFNDKGLYLKDTGVWLPDALRDLMLGNAFTMEFYVEDAALSGASWLGICTSAVRSNNSGENMALFAGTDGKVVLKFHNDGGQRPTTAQNVMPPLNEGALISVTYDTVAQAAVIYINGVEMGRKPVTNQALVDNTYGIALGTITNGAASKRDGQELTYRSIRFYNRALNANEIYANAHFDKMSAATNGYVTDGLVSHYDGVNRGTTDGVWKDLVGNNDITVEKGYSYSNNSALAFNDKGLYLKDTGVWLPDALRDLTLSDAFTMEFYVEDAALSGASWLGICTSAKANNSGESIALYILQANGTMALKFNEDNGQRPTTTQDLMPKLNRGALVSVTFDTVAQAAVIYINGIEMARKPVTNQALVDNTYGIALGTMTKDAAKDRVGQELTYRSIRFYDRALNANEVKANAFVDGFMRYSPDILPVMDGLVSWYDGGQHGTSNTVWEDLYGNNDITVVSDGTSGFINDGYRLYNNSVQLPTGIDSVVRGEAFTVEFSLGDVNRTATWTSILGCTTSGGEDIGFWITYDSDLYFRTKGGEAHFTGSAVSEMVSDTMMTITYDTVKQEIAIYMNGVLLAKNSISAVPAVSKAADALKLSLGHPAVGTVAKRRNQEVNYRSIRFYNRALSESEIKANAFYEGFGHHITVDQPATNIVGDVAMTREINSASELAAMMAAEKLPAAAIYRINKDMQVLDDNGVGFASLLDVLRSTESKVLPVVVPADQDAVSALADWIVEYDFYDISILTKDPALLKAARTKMPVLRGALDLTDVYKDRSELTKDDLINIRKVANTNSATVVRLPAALATKDNVQYLYNRQINVWVGISDTPTTVEKYNALLSGAVGVISDDTAGLLEIACALPTNTMTRTPLNGGHRGLPSKAPECTIEGSMLAYQLGANYIEMDVRLSLDKEVVVIHDGTTNRTCDQNYSIKSTNYWGVLENVKANKGFENDPLFKDCKLSLLDDFFKAFQDIDDCLLVVEIKSEDPAIVPLIKALTEEYGVYDRVFVITFFNNIMEEMRETWPEMSVGALIDPGPLKENDADKTAVDTMKMFGGICTSYDPLTGSLAGNASRATLLRGFQINSWAATTSNLPLRFVSGMASVCHNYADQMGSAIQSFAANVPEKLFLGKSAVISMDLLTYANVDTGDLINAKDVTVTVLEGADLVTVNGNTLTASGLGSVTFIIEYTYECANGNDVQTVSLCTQPITLTVVQGTLIEDAIADADYARDSVVVADRACEAGAGNKYVSAAQMQALNAAIAAAEEKKETATTNEEITAAVKALTDALALFNEATQPGDTHRGEAANSTECKYGCGTTAAAHVLDNEGSPDGGFYLTLQDAIAAADAGDTVKLLADITHATDATPSVITGLNIFYIIDKSLTIDGNGHLITNNALARLFLISGNNINLELKNLKVQNNVKYGKGGDGSIITCDEHPSYNSNTGSLTITNCEFFSVSDLFYLRPYTGGQKLTIKDSLLVSSVQLIVDYRGTTDDYTIEISNSQLYSVSDYIIYTPDCSANIIITSSTLSAPGKSTINDGDVNSKSNITLKGGTVIGKAFSVTAPDGTVISGDAHATAGLILNANNTLTLHNNVQFFCTSGVAFTGAGTVKFGTTDAPYTDTQIIRLSGTTYYFYDTVDAAFTAKQDGDSIFSYAASSVQNKGYVTQTATDANSNTYYTVGAIDTSVIDNAIANANSKKDGIAQAEKPCEAGVGNKYVSAAQMQALNQAIAAAEEKKASATTGGAVIEAVQALNDALESFETAILTGVAHKDDGMDHVCDYGCDVYQGVHADSANDNDHDCEYCGERLNDCTPNEDDGDCTTAITCSVCGEVTTAAKAAHTPGADDGDCTTAVYCTECKKVATAARDAHTGGSPTCQAKATCSLCGTEYGDLVACKDENRDHKCDYNCGNNTMHMDKHIDSDTDDDHFCDYGCGEIADDGCYDIIVDGKCDECGADFAHDCVGEVPCTSTTCKYCGQPVTPIAHDGEFECSTTCKYCNVENTVTDAVAHDGAFDCSTTCKYCNVENTVTDAVAHDGEFECSTTCKYCNVENTVTDAVAHDGEFDCSTTCKYGCGTEILDAVPCSGLHACSTKCQYCGEAVEPTEEHSFDNPCDLTCKVCNEAIEALPHTGVFGCSATCQWCGTAINAAAHDGEFACSTVCKYGCGTVITDAVAHDGELECSTTCKYCGWENWVADAKNHTGAFNCSDTCQWCGVAIEAAAHDGKYACSTECKWCGAENAVTDAVAHEGEYACSTTCKYGCGATIQNAAEHKGEHACSTTCKVCGAAIAATSADHTFESNGDKCDVCGEAKTESDSGMDTVAVIAIVIGVVAVIGVCVTVIVVKRKD